MILNNFQFIYIYASAFKQFIHKKRNKEIFEKLLQVSLRNVLSDALFSSPAVDNIKILINGVFWTPKSVHNEEPVCLKRARELKTNSISKTHVVIQSW